MRSKTIVAPILAFCAVCNVLGADDSKLGQTNSSPREFQATKNAVLTGKGSSLRFKIDGSLDDWKTNGTAWVKPPKPSDNDFDFDITECRFSNDNAYLYLFLRFSPSIEDRFKRLNPDGKIRSFGNLGYFYFRTDSGRFRGAQGLGVRRELMGANKMVAVMSGTRVSEKTALPTVTYLLGDWEPGTTSFYGSPWVRTCADDPPLINYGKDGVELAISLEELFEGKETKFEMIFVSEILRDVCRVVPITLENGKKP